MATFRRKTYRKSYRKRRTLPYKKRSYRRRGVSASAVKAIVKKAISRNVENKTVQYFSSGTNIRNSAATDYFSTIIPCTPYGSVLDIPQGTGQGNRIGNRIKIKNLVFKGVIYPNQYQATNNTIPQPVQVVLWFFYRRSQPSIIPSDLFGFFQEGNVTRNFQNDLTDVNGTVNNDSYRLLTKRVFKIGYADYETSTAGLQPASMSFANNDFKLNRTFKINLTKYAIKMPKFTDSSQTPTSRGIFCIPQVIAASGGKLPGTQLLANMSYELSLSYEDA